MKLCSIINVWACCVELLPFCIKNHLEFCDGVIVIWSQYSNHGVKNDAVLEYILANGHDSRAEFVQVEPWRGVTPLNSETRKRNHGIAIAREKAFTHFLMADADEFYFPSEIEQDKKRMIECDLNGLVSGLRVYIGKPTLWCDDHTLVPTIQKLGPKTMVGDFKQYPFAYTGKTARIDPSRRPNHTSKVEFSNTIVHHYSYVRKDIDLKIDNSSANLRKSREAIHQHVKNAAPGYNSGYGILKECENFFNICV